MRLTGSLFAAAFSLVLSTLTFAQTDQVRTEVARSRCDWLPLSPITKANVVLRDNQKLKGKVVIIRGDQIVIVGNHQTQIVSCTDIARVERPRGFGHRLKVALAIPITLVGFAAVLPGAIVAAAGARDAGLIIATPGLLLVVAGDELSGSNHAGTILLFW
ncbi:MAG: hypothetical protein ACREEM_17955 [Blastocatellia bacterium]